MKSLHIQGAAGSLLLSAWSGEACAGVAHVVNRPVLLQPKGFSLGFPSAPVKRHGDVFACSRKVGEKHQQLPYLTEGEYLSLFPSAEAGQLPGEQPPGAQCPSPDGAGAGEGGEDPGLGS